MIRISWPTPNFSRMSPACRIVLSSDGEAASTPTRVVSSVTLPPCRHSGLCVAAVRAISVRVVMPSNETRATAS